MRKENTVLEAVADLVGSVVITTVIYGITVGTVKATAKVIDFVDGKVSKRLTPEQKEFCESNGLNTSSEYYSRKDIKEINKAIAKSKKDAISSNRAELEKVINS